MYIQSNILNLLNFFVVILVKAQALDVNFIWGMNIARCVCRTVLVPLNFERFIYWFTCKLYIMMA